MPSRRRVSKNTRMILIILAGGAALLFLFTGLDPLKMFPPAATLTSALPATLMPAPAATLISSLPATLLPAPAETGGSSGWWEVAFTDPNRLNDPDQIEGSIEERLIELVAASQATIDIAAFELDLVPLVDALIAASGRGVVIRFMTDDENGIEADQDSGLDLFERLQAAGIQIKDDGRSDLMHDKFIIFDSQIVWTGSTNLTENGIFANNNNALTLFSAQIARIYEDEFDEMWAGEFGPTSPSTVENQLVTIADVPVQILFGSEDPVLGFILELIEETQSSLRFMAFSFTQDDLGQAVLELAQAGVDVRGIFETRASETEFSELGRLFCAGVLVRQDGNSSTFHHKVFVFDERIVLTGSLNFSDSAVEGNDENVVIIEDPALADQFLAEFDRRWAEATQPAAGVFSCP